MTAARELRGVSMRDLARRVGCSKNTVLALSAGLGGNAGVGLLFDIATDLGVEPAWLILGVGKGPS